MADQNTLATALASAAKDHKGIAVVTKTSQAGERLPKVFFTAIGDDGAVYSIMVKRTVAPA